MKKLFVLASSVAVLCGFGMSWHTKTVAASETNKLWVHLEYSVANQPGYDGPQTRFYFVEDLETGTRCYAVVQGFNDGGSSMSCVKK